MGQVALGWCVEGQAGLCEKFTVWCVLVIKNEEENACLVIVTPGSLTLRNKGSCCLCHSSQMSFGLYCLFNSIFITS